MNRLTEAQKAELVAWKGSPDQFDAVLFSVVEKIIDQHGMSRAKVWKEGYETGRVDQDSLIGWSMRVSSGSYGERVPVTADNPYEVS